ncbi:META domain-containing protein [Flavobacterium rakeshii]|uniref:META domain-containing protein n=1 Tax=Flavobacterium rakeshii TaxID=1038845 RepID=UPI002E7C1BD5|nr:META domain-containing protein [Flavobacterium rakeshii]MEE1900005.1 META domain-containing protein [Flavobacterium rakeshii]
MKKLATSTTIIAFIFTLISCKCTEKASVDVLTANTWELSMLNGKTADTADFGRGMPTATFTSENKINGKAGCNGYGGEYQIGKDSSFKVERVIATKMYCVDAQGESSFLRALSDANRIKTQKGKVTLLNGDKEVMVLIPSTK